MRLLAQAAIFLETWTRALLVSLTLTELVSAAAVAQPKPNHEFVRHCIQDRNFADLASLSARKTRTPLRFRRRVNATTLWSIIRCVKEHVEFCLNQYNIFLIHFVTYQSRQSV